MLAVAPLLLALAQSVSPAPPDPDAAPPSPAPPAGPTVQLETSLGRIRILLEPEKAPLSVENFLKYVRSGHYDGTIFHRVIPNFMIQGGGYDPDLSERPTRPPIKNEAKNGLRNLRGTLAMARTNDPHSATAQFFINLKDNAGLDYGIRGAGYAVFGRVVEGMDVVDRIAAVPTTLKGYHPNAPVTPVMIKQVRELRATGAGGPSLRTAPAPPAAAH